MKRLAALLLGASVGLALCEAVTRMLADRLLDLSHPTVRFDPELGWVQRAGTTAVRHNEQGQEIAIAGSTLGIRQPPVPYALDPATSVLVVGDSLTAGTQVRFEDTWTAQLGERLRRRHPGLTIVNAGVDRYDLSQEFRLARRLWGRFHPRHLLVALYLGNDVIDYEREGQARPPWRGGGAGEIVAEHSFLFHFLKGVGFKKRRSSPETPPRSVVDDWSPRSVAGWDALADGERARIRGQFAAGDVVSVWRGGKDADRRLGSTEKMIAAFSALAHDKGAGLTVVFLPMKQEVIPEQRAEILALHRLSDEDLERPRLRLLSWAEAHGISAWDATPHLRKHPRPEDLYWRVDLHMTPVGHAYLADGIAPVLDRGLAVKR